MPYADKEKQKKYEREYARRNREHYKDLERQWRLDHPEYAKNYNQAHPNRNKNRNGVRYRTKEQANAQSHAEKIPLSKFCELCPEDDVRPATQRHHPDYKYLTIFVSCCASCHAYVDKGEKINA